MQGCLALRAKPDRRAKVIQVSFVMCGRKREAHLGRSLSGTQHKKRAKHSKFFESYGRLLHWIPDFVGAKERLLVRDDVSH